MADAQNVATHSARRRVLIVEDEPAIQQEDYHLRVRPDLAVHTSGVYAARGANPMTNQSDGIFSDSLASEIVTPTGSPTGGYAASFQIGVAV